MAKVAVAMSGGVDSAVAALLLLRSGHEVLGLSLRLSQGADQAWRNGAQVAGQLGVPHQVIDARREFACSVVEPSVDAYVGGLTPNPCAWCNATVKLPILWQAAREAGCQALATGHYARLVESPRGPGLAEGADRAKSQAYFLARVEPNLLANLLFPLGELTKAEVRRLAGQAGLEAALRPESQDNCFLPAGGWDELVAERHGLRPGPLEDQQGRVLGRHGGIHRFTIGQRRGLGVALGRPMYVLALDAQRAAVRLGPESGLWMGGLLGGEPLWYAPREAAASLTVRVRYAHTGVFCQAEETAHGLAVRFAEPQRAVAPGQLAVFYHQELVVGSAWIKEAIP